MKITNVKVKLVNNKELKLKGFAMVTIDDAIVIRDIKILESVNGLYIGMPSKKRDDNFRNIIHPINTAARVQLTDAVLNEYKSAVENGQCEQSNEELAT